MLTALSLRTQVQVDRGISWELATQMLQNHLAAHEPEALANGAVVKQEPGMAAANGAAASRQRTASDSRADSDAAADSQAQRIVDIDLTQDNSDVEEAEASGPRRATANGQAAGTSASRPKSTSGFYRARALGPGNVIHVMLALQVNSFCSVCFLSGLHTYGCQSDIAGCCMTSFSLTIQVPGKLPKSFQIYRAATGKYPTLVLQTELNRKCACLSLPMSITWVF